MMNTMLLENLFEKKVARRDFLWLIAVSLGGTIAGCVTNPVTGEHQLMLLSEGEEIAIDRENAAHQFSLDLGAVQDSALNAYLTTVGQKLATVSHRPQMPFSFRAVNAVYINAYAFPGGSIAVTRGILVDLNNEAELAALLGHEIGHVNARHTAQQVSKNMLFNVALSGATALAGDYGSWVSNLGGIGASALLARYSRENEREADALAMEYMTKAGYNPDGMVGLMELLRSLSKRQPSVIETMFSTHPMSEERFLTAVDATQGQYASFRSRSLDQERYLDRTAGLRKIKGAIKKMQKGEEAMAAKRYSEAEGLFREALQEVPNDYAGMILMSKCLIAQGKDKEAKLYAQRAKEAYPTEAQAYNVAGIANLMSEQFDSAYQDFLTYEKKLPGNPNTVFLMGASLEGMQKRESAAEHYYRYLQMVGEGDQATYAYQRLVEWGYIKR